MPSALKGKTIRVQAQAATTGGYILTLARAADANIIVDASALPTTDPPLTSDNQGEFIKLLLDFAQERHLTALTYDPQTMLMWHEPDVVALAREVIADETSIEAKTVRNASQQAFNSFALDKLLTTYFQATYGWNGRAPGFSKDIKLADLPPAVQSQVMAAVESEILDARGLTHWRLWLTDEFWQRARLWVQPSQDQGKPIQILFTGYKGKQWASVRSVAILNAPAGNPNALPQPAHEPVQSARQRLPTMPQTGAPVKPALNPATPSALQNDAAL